MKMRNVTALLLAGALAAAALQSCSQSELSAEMRQQEADMKSELVSWQNDVEKWNTNNDRMRREHEGHSARAGSDLERELTAHVEKLAEHQRNVDAFEKTLDEHRTEVEREAARPERDRVMAHAGLWAKHKTVQASHASLAMTNEAMLDEHTDLISKLAVAR
jgi:hypothetical protein